MIQYSHKKVENLSSTWRYGLEFIVVAIIIGLLILVHEVGHLLAAFYVGIPVNNFSIGFGPKLWRKTIGKVNYSLGIIPLGGYVLAAMDDVNRFFAISSAKRMFFSLGGPLANIVLGMILLMGANVLYGGLSIQAICIQPMQQLIFMIQNIPLLFTQMDQMLGVVGIVAQGSQVVQNGLADLLFFAGFLSMNLAIFNLLPLPILDGGQILLTILESIVPVIKRIRMPLALTSWLLLLALMIYVTTQDVLRITTVAMVQ